MKLLAVCLLIVGLVTACVVQAQQAQEVVIVATDHRFEMPDTLTAGVVKLTLQNKGSEPHHAQLARIKDGVAYEEVLAALKLSPNAVFSMVTFEGGPATVAPDGSATVYVGLLPGTYLVLCFLEGADGVPHLAHGMISAFAVVDSPLAAGGPSVDVLADMSDFSFVIPDKLSAGTQVWRVSNDGSQPHELALVRLLEGKTLADVMMFLQQGKGDLPMLPVGGMQALSSGGEAWMEVTLEPGTYVALCFVPDPSSGHPHLSLGMVRQVVVE